ILVQRHMMSDIAAGFWQAYNAGLELWDISLIPSPMQRVFLRKEKPAMRSAWRAFSKRSCHAY
ncbi:hypothetical protein, partial [Brucella anthropi]|uniref:hypothetical protein n=1 Tax=Brucella anthropi TaxID=529 RepID=UPI001AED62AF